MTLERLAGKTRRLAVLARDVGRFEWTFLRGGDGVPPATAAEAARQWLRTLQRAPLPPIRGRILVTALRNCTWIEWAAYFACVTRQLGFASTIAYRGSQVTAAYRGPRLLNFWEQVGRIPDIELVDLEACPVDPKRAEALRPVARAAAASTLAYDLHVEEHDIHSQPDRHADSLARAEESGARLGAALDGVLQRRQFDRFVCYSGLIGETPALLAVARQHGLTTVCLEGWGWRPGHMIYNFNAPALEYNVTGWMESLGPWDAAKEREVDAYLKFLDGEKHDAEWLTNFYRVQRDALRAALPARLQAFVEGEAPVFLAAPNVIGDSSTLNRETIFPSQQVWLAGLVEWFAARPHLKLVIRAHPAELWMGAKCTIYLGQFARKLAAGRPNIEVIDSAERVNTFSLVPFARAGLAWLSSAGVDFVVRGLPAAVAAKPKYGGLGIVEEPGSVEEYFALLERWAARAARPSPAQMTTAKRYLHMVFKGFSFEAGGRNYRATGCQLGRMPNQAEHDRFYRILVGDERAPDS